MGRRTTQGLDRRLSGVFLTIFVGLIASSAYGGDVWWSLKPLSRPSIPAPKDAGWAQNAIDVFILEKLEAAGLQPAPPADPATLIRRLSLDLLGLPPTLEEVDEFLADASPAAYERLVDRLLASPRYGERWARHWLDVARFSESHGFEFDKPRDHAWPYRDSVIRSFNEDKPYTVFITEQIAGDVLEPETRDGIAATGFLVAGPWDEAGFKISKSEVMKARAREEELEDTISAVSQTFLAMTVNCARCHDHKFDPIPQRDYYRVRAVFGAVRHGERSLLPPDEMRVQEEDSRRRAAAISALEGKLAAIEKAPRARIAEKRGRPAAPLPLPIARWSFDAGADDEIGAIRGSLEGGAAVSGGRLRLAGGGAFLRSEPLARPLKAKTLEAWVALARLDQKGGGVISVETPDGRVFDAVVFGERKDRSWLAGSDNYTRTRDLDGPTESARPSELVHVAIAYSPDGRIAVYRNGKLYGAEYAPQDRPPAFPAGGARVLLGLRHTGAASGFFEGEIEEARLYDRALSAAEVEASFRGGHGGISEEEIARAMSDTEGTERAKLKKTLARERQLLREAERLPMVYAGAPEKPEASFVLIRGDVEKRGEEVSPGGLSAVAAPPGDFALPAGASEGLGRLRFAEWVASPENPLTARVMANRIWHYHFGRGIAAATSDFGRNGEPPSHPQLLDWLAREFIDGGWSVKRIQRLIVLSSTYRQSSRGDARAAAIDAENRLLGRFGARRLEAEAIRDSLLAASGELNLKMYGPGFRPFTVEIFNSYLYTPTDPEGAEYNRRTIYRHVVHSARDPVLDALDCPDPSTKTPQRAITTTPLQSLALMNDSFVERQGRRLAERVVREYADSPADRIDRAYRLALARAPSQDEARRAADLCRDHGLESLAWALFNSSEFLYQR